MMCPKKEEEKKKKEKKRKLLQTQKVLAGMILEISELVMEVSISLFKKQTIILKSNSSLLQAFWS